MPSFPIRKTEDVARAWATQDRVKGRAASASFSGQDLFSYGTLIARIVQNPRHQFTVALVASSWRSTSTAVVRNQAWSAARDAGLRCFSVPDARLDHEAAIRHYDAAIGERLAKVETALKPEDHRRMANTILTEQRLYIRTFGLVLKTQWTPAKIAKVRSRREREA